MTGLRVRCDVAEEENLIDIPLSEMKHGEATTTGRETTFLSAPMIFDRARSQWKRPKCCHDPNLHDPRNAMFPVLKKDPSTIRRCAGRAECCNSSRCVRLVGLPGSDEMRSSSDTAVCYQHSGDFCLKIERAVGVLESSPRLLQGSEKRTARKSVMCPSNWGKTRRVTVNELRKCLRWRMLLELSRLCVANM